MVTQNLSILLTTNRTNKKGFQRTMSITIFVIVSVAKNKIIMLFS